jgi:Domain of unknown function (DUF4252)
MKKIALIVMLTAGVALAQEFHEMINFDALKSKAEETVEVNLDGNLLRMAMAFLSDKNPDEAQAKKLIGGIKGIYVRSLKFEKPGMYSAADVDRIRGLLKGPEWSKVVNVESTRKHGENVGVYIRTDGSQMKGLVVLAFEPEELTVVNIVGVFDPAQVRALGGKLGIPPVWDNDQRNRRKNRDKDDKEEEER